MVVVTVWKEASHSEDLSKHAGDLESGEKSVGNGPTSQSYAADLRNAFSLSQRSDSYMDRCLPKQDLSKIVGSSQREYFMSLIVRTLRSDEGS